MTSADASRGSDRRTKIVCTIGPATSSEEQLRALIASGMNVARLNFSHGNLESHGRSIGLIRRLADELGVAVAILQDLAGPKVRVGSFVEGGVELRAGEQFTLTARSVEGSEHEVSVSYPLLPREVKAGDRLLLADGTLQLQVQEVVGEDIRCLVLVGGNLSERKGVNVPSGLFGLPILREKDLEDLRFGVERGVDYLGLSFVRTAEDVRTAKDEVVKLGGDVPIVAKIETQAALERFDEILDEADGIMIARGDLSLETPFARVPMVQKELIAKANGRAKPVITATQMLFSMVNSPHPTRAEVADVANAVMDGSDAVMLSDETTVGKYPVLAAETMATIAETTEDAARRVAPREARTADGERAPRSDVEAFALGACELAARLPVDVIATMTRNGETARLVAKYRPSRPILAVTPRPETYRRLALVRGVTPLLLRTDAQESDEMISAARDVLCEQGWMGKDAVVVSRNSVRREVIRR